MRRLPVILAALAVLTLLLISPNRAANVVAVRGNRPTTTQGPNSNETLGAHIIDVRVRDTCPDGKRWYKGRCRNIISLRSKR